jgi:hypothetical protein
MIVIQRLYAFTVGFYFYADFNLFFFEISKMLIIIGTTVRQKNKHYKRYFIFLIIFID